MRFFSISLAIIAISLMLAACDGVWIRRIEVSESDVVKVAQVTVPAPNITQIVTQVLTGKYGYICDPGGDNDYWGGTPLLQCHRAWYENVEVIKYSDVYEVRAQMMHPGWGGKPPQVFNSSVTDLFKGLTDVYGAGVTISDTFPDRKPDPNKSQGSI